MSLLRYVLVAGPRVHSSTSKEMTMTPTEWLILTITTFVVVDCGWRMVLPDNSLKLLGV